eukprot:3284493-Rhodomonas_salina.2
MTRTNARRVWGARVFSGVESSSSTPDDNVSLSRCHQAESESHPSPIQRLLGRTRRTLPLSLKPGSPCFKSSLSLSLSFLSLVLRLPLSLSLRPVSYTHLRAHETEADL